MAFESGFSPNMETKKAREFEIELIGNPSPEVVLASRRGIENTLAYLEYKGDEMPIVHICEGIIVDENGNKLADGGYIRKKDSPDGKGHIYLSNRSALHSIEDLKSPITGKSFEGRALSPDAITFLSASHETIHFVQDVQGKIGDEDIDNLAYRDRPHEIEAYEISKKILLQEYGIKQLIFSDLEGKIKLLHCILKEIYFETPKFIINKILPK